VETQQLRLIAANVALPAMCKQEQGLEQMQWYPDPKQELEAFVPQERRAL
jgi:hypothetical protein